MNSVYELSQNAAKIALTTFNPTDSNHRNFNYLKRLFSDLEKAQQAEFDKIKSEYLAEKNEKWYFGKHLAFLGSRFSFTLPNTPLDRENTIKASLMELANLPTTPPKKQSTESIKTAPPMSSSYYPPILPTYQPLERSAKLLNSNKRLQTHFQTINQQELVIFQKEASRLLENQKKPEQNGEDVIKKKIRQAVDAEISINMAKGTLAIATLVGGTAWIYSRYSKRE